MPVGEVRGLGCVVDWRKARTRWGSGRGIGHRPYKGWEGEVVHKSSRRYARSKVGR